ncbi:hypothetical protein Acsp06_29860 [Actinomycetospora sp. NBRC 106375]|uniref:hypothetical protein n=1 Tax=Actinomycetospora sp. NBRC 106375 TaxID=3032207 RepID=UPI0024A510A0|nr:hypothetical protein [Actinomycetospora sp. NBRC 106375]GLZ46801.1 hypothetical protein Acsp06_29860 [Actinomycetospora sp. NBRC 106375]
MLKKAGMVVLGATAGMLSLAPLANAGEAPSHGDNGDHGHHWQHDGHGHDGHGGRGDCDKFAGSAGDRLVSLDNVASNATISHVNVLAEDNSRSGDCDGDGGRDGRHGHRGDRDGDGDRKVAFSAGDRLISADNLLANADLSHVNVLSTDNSR